MIPTEDNHSLATAYYYRNNPCYHIVPKGRKFSVETPIVKAVGFCCTTIKKVTLCKGVNNA